MTHENIPERKGGRIGVQAKLIRKGNWDERLKNCHTEAQGNEEDERGAAIGDDVPPTTGIAGDNACIKAVNACNGAYYERASGVTEAEKGDHDGQQGCKRSREERRNRFE
jgi:hypothetical protein